MYICYPNPSPNPNSSICTYICSCIYVCTSLPFFWAPPVVRQSFQLFNGYFFQGV